MDRHAADYQRMQDDLEEKAESLATIPIGAHTRLQTDSEHGQQWLTCLDCGAQWHDSDPPEQVSDGDGSCDEQALADETATHWSYGSGYTGCLYDGGPGFAPTLADAIDAAMSVFFDISEECQQAARTALEEEGIYRFPSDSGACCDYVEVVEQQGPCPESDD